MATTGRLAPEIIGLHLLGRSVVQRLHIMFTITRERVEVKAAHCAVGVSSGRRSQGVIVHGSARWDVDARRGGLRFTRCH